MSAEDHGAGTQYVRFRIRPKYSTGDAVLVGILALLSLAAGLDGAWPVSAVLGAAAFLLAYKEVRDCGAATAAILQVVTQPVRAEEPAGAGEVSKASEASQDAAKQNQAHA
jgi:hypothetical protein